MAGQNAGRVGSGCKFYQALIRDLSAYAEGYFELAELQEDGLTLETHLKSHWRQSGQMPSQLDTTPLPFELCHVWEWWCLLNKRRQSGMDVCTITFTEIKAWKELYELKTTPFEIDCILMLESVYMRIQAEQNARRQPSQSQDT